MTGQQLTIEEAISNRNGVLHLIAGDPRRSPSVRAVAETIATHCHVGDRVSANVIRPHLPPWIDRNAIGPVFGALARAGALRKVDSIVSTDEGTHGKVVGCYLVLADALEAIEAAS